MMMLYICFSQLNGLFEISRYKGLGQMRPEDCFNTLMNPETRSLTRVTSAGKPDENYALLGKDTSERKRLLTTTTVLSHIFARDNVQEQL
jgi:DNA gyrase/topoisomerase IV subunit B